MSEDLLPCVAKFLDEHPEYGRPVTLAPLMDWAYGKRQWVTCQMGLRGVFARRNYLFYERDGAVDTIYQISKNNQRVRVYAQA